MHKYHVAVGIIGVLVALAVGVGFFVAGTPVSQTAIRYDETRYNDFQQIRYRVEEHYRINGTLPESLSEVSLSTTPDTSTNDPMTGDSYEYKVVSTEAYQLCTGFATDAETFKKYGRSYFDFPITHTKGYSCVDFKIPAQLKNDVNAESSATVPAP
jgi:hypothetical protein